MKATKNLASEIKRQGRQMKTFGDLIGMDSAQFSHVVNSRRDIKWDDAARIAAALGWPLFFLFELPIGKESNTIGNPKEASAA